MGPNAIIRVVEALTEARGRDDAVALLQAAGLAGYIDALPTAMVDECEVTALQTALRARLDLPEARRIAWDAGLRTGDYLLANRIPRPAQRLLAVLPARLAARVLIKAIRANAWTFGGTGRFDANPAYPPRLSMTDSPICRGAVADQPVCDYFAGTYERLFSRLVQRQARVTEIACQAQGAPSCLFEVRW